MPREQEVTLYGGGVLILDEYGRLKFHVRNKILNFERQTRRLRYLWRNR
jgi:transcriptional regulator with AAA-type ATPase domain